MVRTGKLRYDQTEQIGRFEFMANSIDILVGAFEKCFEESSVGYLYRINLKAPAVLVTRAEKEKFVKDYSTKTRTVLWASCIISITIEVALSLWSFKEKKFDIDTIKIWPIFAVLFISSFITAPLLNFIRKEPARQLRDRPAISSAYTRKEAARIEFARISWRLLVCGLISTVFLLVMAVTAHLDLPTQLMLFTFGAVCGIACIIQAIRKWIVERAATR